MGQVFIDLRYSSRMLLKNPGTTLIAVLTLALGIGTNTAVFSWTDAILWKPLALPHLDRLLVILERSQKETTWNWSSWGPVAPANYFDWKQQAQVFAQMAAYRIDGFNFSAAGIEPEQVMGYRVSANLISMTGVTPWMGRTFQVDEELEGRDHVVVLGYGLWQRRFGSDPGLIGKTILVDRSPRTVIGIMPLDFDFPLAGELWVPLVLSAEQKNSRTAHNLFALALLKEGVSRRQAQTEIEGISKQLELQYPLTNKGWSVRVLPLREHVVPEMAAKYMLLNLGSMGFVLLIACVNVANLQLARMSGRRRELGIRLSLGASQWRLLQQLLTENVLLALLGGGLGVIMAFWSLDLVRVSFPPDYAKWIAGWRSVSIDGRTLAFTLVLSLASGILSGLAPAVRCSKTSLNESLKEGGRGAGIPRRHGRLRGLLVVSEVALTLVLLIGAGLMIKAFRQLIDMEVKSDPSTLLTMRLSLNGPSYELPSRLVNYCDQVLERLRILPGVQSVAAASFLPHTGRGGSSPFSIEGRPVLDASEQRNSLIASVSGDYFKTMRIPLLSGRGLTRQDGAGSPQVALVSERMANRYWPGKDPLGRRLKLGGQDSSSPWMTVVGIVGDVRQFAYEKEVQPVLYLPYSQSPTLSIDLAIRADAVARLPGLIRSVRKTIHSLDVETSPFQVKTMEQLITFEMLGTRFVAALMIVFGALAVLLASAGVYGVLAYSVREQSHEIGVRMALGARPADVLGMVMKQGLGLVLTGLVFGLVLAFVLGKMLSSLILGVQATDPATFLTFTLILIVVAASACYFPARRAALVDPVVVLRYE